MTEAKKHYLAANPIKLQDSRSPFVQPDVTTGNETFIPVANRACSNRRYDEVIRNHSADDVLSLAIALASFKVKKNSNNYIKRK